MVRVDDIGIWTIGTWFKKDQAADHSIRTGRRIRGIMLRKTLGYIFENRMNRIESNRIESNGKERKGNESLGWISRYDLSRFLTVIDQGITWLHFQYIFYPIF
jgi:hypothetical protein